MTASRDTAGPRPAPSPSHVAPDRAAPALVSALARDGGGHPLPPAVRDRMTRRLGHDFSTVRVHADTAAAGVARRLDANAATLGEDVVFDAGRYDPASPAGDRLLGHELAHVVAQRHGFEVGRVQLDGPRTPADIQREFEQDRELAAQAPPWWLSLLGPAYVLAWYRNPALRVRHPLLRAQADLTTRGAAAAGAGTSATVAAVTGVAAGATTLLVAGLSLPIVMGIAVEAVVGSATLAPAVALVLSHPIAATEIGLFVAGQTMQVVAAGGLRAYLDQITTTEGLVNLGFDIAFHAQAIGPSGGAPETLRPRGRGRLVAPGTLEVTVTETPVSGPPRPPKTPTPATGTAASKDFRGHAEAHGAPARPTAKPAATTPSARGTLNKVATGDKAERTWQQRSGAVDLNTYQAKFPALDTASGTELTQVKAYGPPDPARRYVNDLHDLATDPGIGAGAVKAVGALERAGAKAQAKGGSLALPPEYAKDPEGYIRQQTVFRIPDDHVEATRNLIVGQVTASPTHQNFGLPAPLSPEAARAYAAQRVKGLGAKYDDVAVYNPPDAR
ncbi:hypothetical protein Acsp06_43760 [Actinomycetospora sp. NBRC 106375]|uniref:eCIS core domain-containing protein n=1 Tax=Actinomycetospora sp. NBRC 106375 TaxID=3032207 RepID=UPI0024A2EA95|nr:DUF4157 domain-containing protein [Actinomycetospora sp. NBRC 106375]GLZ48191.1 hypothetical protein Acsp06_43760 [Actinomycetospora sp. NBRC 106375]